MDRSGSSPKEDGRQRLVPRPANVYMGATVVFFLGNVNLGYPQKVRKLE